ncbi:hypothetical protein [Photobacterium rosenbergii]|uniref:hypothetical protein n=1 Tax=Photobacterium rosenbergii TaxID=294936 RepID=UPI001C993FFD|nr:hypothetical protein [Photobacterium rosenbergii]MBY5946103.1 hypothetical protein [Photobacterium rosenbergii]
MSSQKACPVCGQTEFLVSSNLIICICGAAFIEAEENGQLADHSLLSSIQYSGYVQD